MPLPVAPFDACRKQAARRTRSRWSASTDNDYSVPVRRGPSRGHGQGLLGSGGDLPRRRAGGRAIARLWAQGRDQCTSPGTTCRCWTASPAPWITAAPAGAASCRTASPCCAGAWRTTGRAPGDQGLHHGPADVREALDRPGGRRHRARPWPSAPPRPTWWRCTCTRTSRPSRGPSCWTAGRTCSGRADRRRRGPRSIAISCLGGGVMSRGEGDRASGAPPQGSEAADGAAGVRSRWRRPAPGQGRLRDLPAAADRARAARS